MALSKQKLINNIQSIYDINKGISPKDLNDASKKWSNVFYDYCKTITPPSTTLLQAKDVFRTTFLGISYENGIKQFPLCFVNFIDIYVQGTQPNFTSTPPVLPLDFTPVNNFGLNGGKTIDCIKLFSEIIDVWVKTGFSVNNASGVSIIWS